MNTEVGKSSDRLISLDVFRGITVAGMVLVNNPGDWSHVYVPLEHAAWNGWTPTDMIFPFFLFIVGVSISLALGRRVGQKSAIKRDVYLKIFRRAAIIFLLGLFQMAFPFFDLAHLRFPGVLQRIAVCYLISSLIFLHTSWKQQTIIAVVCLIFYCIVMTLVPVPGGVAGDLSVEGNFAGYVDRLVIGANHMWTVSKFYDPEGILSTIPAVATCIAGVLTGTWLKSERADEEKVSAVFFFGILLTAIGWIWSFWFPINKALWTSSYAVYMAGLALCFLGFCFWLIDIKNYRKWTKPFVIFGSNALALYFLSSIFARIINNIKWQTASGGAATNVQKWIFDTFFSSLASPFNASLIYSIFYIFLWLFLMWILYRKKIFIKV